MENCSAYVSLFSYCPGPIYAMPLATFTDLLCPSTHLPHFCLPVLPLCPPPTLLLTCSPLFNLLFPFAHLSPQKKDAVEKKTDTQEVWEELHNLRQMLRVALDTVQTTARVVASDHGSRVTSLHPTPQPSPRPAARRGTASGGAGADEE